MEMCIKYLVRVMPKALAHNVIASQQRFLEGRDTDRCDTTRGRPISWSNDAACAPTGRVQFIKLCRACALLTLLLVSSLSEQGTIVASALVTVIQ